MKYMLLLYDNEAAAAGMSEAEGNAIMGAYYTFTSDIQANGTYQGGEALQPVSTATTVRVRSGNTQTTDGPFAETHEQLGGFYVVDCKDLDEAIATAAKIPAAATGSVEVRPILEMGDMPAQG